MEEILDFLIKAGNLKKMPRTGFVWLGVQEPETIAQHIYRVALMNWILGMKGKRKMDLEKVIKISLVHDICEVYAGDMTPYWGLLPADPALRLEMLKHYVRLPKGLKLKRGRIKHNKEKKALQKLIKGLEPKTRKEMLDHWMDYEKMASREGRFVKQGDKVETLLQALEYWGSTPDTPVMGWWEEVDEIVDDPVLRDFLDRLEKNFYGKKEALGEIDFLMKIGKFKKMPRRGWVLREVKDPETIVEHAFLMALAVWLLGSKKRLNHEKMLKMSLAYEICEIYAGDSTPYDKLISGGNKNDVLKRWPKLLKKEKEKLFLQDYKKERKALEKLTANLNPGLKKELIGLWDECKRQTTFEGTFVNQVYWLTTYLQALQYYKINKKFPIWGWYEQVRQYIYDPLLIEFLDIEEKKFLSRKMIIDPDQQSTA
jgi:putative hydrolases of HD superfamily